VEPENEDSACVQRILNGEKHCYEEIVKRYQTRVYSLLLMMVRDRPGAEEVTQDTFMRAYSNMHRYDLQKAFYPWLATIATRLGINWINRAGANRHGLEHDSDAMELSALTPPPADQLEVHQDKQQLWNQVASLPQGERTAILLFYKQGLQVNDIANILGVATGTVKTLLHRGRTHLKSRMNANGEAL
jgi:RNA polymerase sigma-70 factor (ECF subfamily)